MYLYKKLFNKIKINRFIRGHKNIFHIIIFIMLLQKFYFSIKYLFTFLLRMNIRIEISISLKFITTKQFICFREHLFQLFRRLLFGMLRASSRSWFMFHVSICKEKKINVNKFLSKLKNKIFVIRFFFWCYLIIQDSFIHGVV